MVCDVERFYGSDFLGCDHFYRGVGCLRQGEMSMKTEKHLTLVDTGYPTGLSKIAQPYWDIRYAMLAMGDNLDAPEFVCAGSVFYAPICNEALPVMALRTL